MIKTPLMKGVRTGSSFIQGWQAHLTYMDTIHAWLRHFGGRRHQTRLERLKHKVYEQALKFRFKIFTMKSSTRHFSRGFDSPKSVGSNNVRQLVINHEPSERKLRSPRYNHGKVPCQLKVLQVLHGENTSNVLARLASTRAVKDGWLQIEMLSA